MHDEPESADTLRRLPEAFQKALRDVFESLPDELSSVVWAEDHQHTPHKILLPERLAQQHQLPSTCVVRHIKVASQVDHEIALAQLASDFGYGPRLYRHSADGRVMLLEDVPAREHEDAPYSTHHHTDHGVLHELGVHMRRMHAVPWDKIPDSARREHPHFDRQQPGVRTDAREGPGASFARYQWQADCAFQCFHLPPWVRLACEKGFGLLNSLEGGKTLVHLNVDADHMSADAAHTPPRVVLHDFALSGCDHPEIDLITTFERMHLSPSQKTSFLAGYCHDAEEQHHVQQCLESLKHVGSVVRAFAPYWALVARCPMDDPQYWHNIPKISGRCDLSGALEQAWRVVAGENQDASPYHPVVWDALITHCRCLHNFAPECGPGALERDQDVSESHPHTQALCFLKASCLGAHHERETTATAEGSDRCSERDRSRRLHPF